MLLRRLQRLTGSSILRGSTAVIPSLKRKATNSWCAVQDTYFSTKDIFERHRVVFTISTSLASVLTAWAGYSLRYHHQSKVEQKLESIELAGLYWIFRLLCFIVTITSCLSAKFCHAVPIFYEIFNSVGHTEYVHIQMKNNYDLEHQEIKRIVRSGNVSTTTCVATGLTTLAIGYGLGWRGGCWYTNRKLRREQLKMMGQMKPNKWRLMKKPMIQSRIFGSIRKSKEMANSKEEVDIIIPSKADADGLASQQACRS